MARAARYAGRQATRLGLLIAVTACAVIEDPPGGPPDWTPPVLLSVVPDSGASVPDFDGAVRFQFDEVINESSGGGLDKMIEFSPRSEDLRVSWKRSAIEVKPKDGWMPGVVYQVALLPGVSDLRNNRMEAGGRVVFTTGAEIPDTRLEGTVLDWEDGRVGQRALVEAILLPDSLVYVGQADSVGEFSLAQLPRGEYLVLASIDGNNNRRRERREAFDSLRINLDTTAYHVFWAFVSDTTGPRVRQATAVDSMTIRVEFSQKLPPGPPPTDALAVWALPDTVPVAIAAVYEATTFDSVQAAEREVAAAAAAEAAAAAADSAAATDSLAAEEAVETPPAVLAEDAAEAAAAPDTTAAAADSTRALQLLAERPELSDILMIRVSAPLPPGNYLITAVIANLSGAVGESRAAVRIEETPADSL